MKNVRYNISGSITSLRDSFKSHEINNIYNNSHKFIKIRIEIIRGCRIEIIRGCAMNRHKVLGRIDTK